MGKIVAFSPKNRDEGGGVPQGRDPIAGALVGVAEKASDLVALSDIRGFYADRIGNNPRHRKFFDVLEKKRVLYVLQEKDGDLLPTDTVCVLSYNTEDEVPEKISMSVADFFRYTSEDPLVAVNYGWYIMEYGRIHHYMIESEDDDPSDFDTIESVSLTEVPNFFPEAIPMGSLDNENGYEYVIIEVTDGTQVPSTNFILDENYIPPLLYLLIEAAYQFDSMEDDDSLLQISKYGSGKTHSLIIVLSYGQLLDVIDSAIVRSFTLIPAKYNTPEKRRDFIRTKIVVDRLDPKLLGGKYVPPERE